MMAAWGSDLFQTRAQCMDVNTRNYTWYESCSNMCQMCDMGEDELVEYELLIHRPGSGAIPNHVQHQDQYISKTSLFPAQDIQ
ncbi:hypothetical protein E2C01_028431 [Portunus trituberculatus]|uniref:Uncharacterized protein n=1 Tax=Portunus trituberculatus TaxID=210409 RepID=A0A5B7EQ01_PORTR|nr:hypothetical protein [Portunus trituberculatus]